MAPRADGGSMRAADDAAALFSHDREQGFARFLELLAQRPDDGYLNLVYAETLLANGERSGLKKHFEIAAQNCWIPALQDRARTGAERAAGGGVSGAPIDRSVPSETDLARAHAEFLKSEPRAVVYDACALMIEQALQKKHLSIALPSLALLQSWNFALYEGGQAEMDEKHFADLESVLRLEQDTLLGFRARSIQSCSAADERKVVALFDALDAVVQRTGAAKILHLWAPEFFPLWDTKIRQGYGVVECPPWGHRYWDFMQVVLGQVTRMTDTPGGSRLKALDEFNYCRHTLKRI